MTVTEGAQGGEVNAFAGTMRNAGIGNRAQFKPQQGSLSKS
jgi:hypothetical protein